MPGSNEFVEPDPAARCSLAEEACRLSPAQDLQVASLRLRSCCRPYVAADWPQSTAHQPSCVHPAEGDFSAGALRELAQCPPLRTCSAGPDTLAAWRCGADVPIYHTNCV